MRIGECRTPNVGCITIKNYYLRITAHRRQKNQSTGKPPRFTALKTNRDDEPTLFEFIVSKSSKLACYEDRFVGTCLQSWYSTQFVRRGKRHHNQHRRHVALAIHLWWICRLSIRNFYKLQDVTNHRYHDRIQ